MISASTAHVLGVRLTATGPQRAALQVAELAANGTAGHIHFVNAYTTVLAHEQEGLREVLGHGAINFPDGKPLAWIGSRRLKGMEQIPGPALFESVFAQDDGARLRHFLLGGDTDTLRLLEAKLHELAPQARVVGTESPPFRDLTPEERTAQDGRVRASGANIVWVGLGTPKQDFEVARLSRSTGTLCVAVGAAFDFTAGTKTRAPRWMRASGLEWLHRLLSEPRRLWRRYLYGNTKFIVLAVKDALARSRQP